MQKPPHTPLIFQGVEIGGRNHGPCAGYLNAACNASRWIQEHIAGVKQASIKLGHNAVHVDAVTDHGPEELTFHFLTGELVKVNGKTQRSKPGVLDRPKYDARRLGLPTGATFIFGQPVGA